MTALVVAAADDAGNILVDCEAVTPSSEDALFPKAHLTDGEIGALFKFASPAAANANVIFDLNRLLNGGFETWPIADPLPSRGWVNDSSGTGAIARETTIVNAGGSTIAAKLTGGGAGNEARLRKDIRVLPGWAMTISLAIRGDATNAMNIYIQNQETGSYLLSDETWSATKTAYATEIPATYSAEGTPANFTVEAASVGLRGIYTLRCWAEQVTGTGYVDDWWIWPHWDFGAIFGHNLSANITARVRSDNNAAMSSPTNQIAFTLRRPSMYGKPAAMVTERWAQFYADGTNAKPGEFAELVLSQKLTLPGAPLHVDDISMTPDIGISGDSRRPASTREDESMAFPVEFVLTAADWADMKVRFYGATRWGGKRTILVPLDEAGGDVYYGTFAIRSVDRMRTMGSHRRVSGEFTELEYAVRTT